nr:hypothetical protein [Pantoea agglomerans]
MTPLWGGWQLERLNTGCRTLGAGCRQQHHFGQCDQRRGHGGCRQPGYPGAGT